MVLGFSGTGPALTLHKYQPLWHFLALSGDQPWRSALVLYGDHPPLALSGDQPLWPSAVLLPHDPMGVHTSFGISSAKRFSAPGKFGRSAPWQLVAPALGRSSVWLSALSCLLSLALDHFRILRQTSLTSPLQCLATPALIHYGAWPVHHCGTVTVGTSSHTLAPHPSGARPIQCPVLWRSTAVFCRSGNGMLSAWSLQCSTL